MENSSNLIQYIHINLESVSKPFASIFKKEYGLSANLMSIMWYLKSIESISMGDMAEKMNVSKQQLTILVDSLVQKGCVTRIYPKENRRLIHITLSDQGKEVLSEAERHFNVLFEDQIKLLGDTEKEELLNAIDTIVRIMPTINMRQ